MKAYTRWHRFDDNGVKYIKRFEIGVIPNPISEFGYTDWSRGTGPHSEHARLKLQLAVTKACKGVPKSPETKEKMRIAKLGIPKSEQHKLNMKLSWQKRRELQTKPTKEKHGTPIKKVQRKSYTN